MNDLLPVINAPPNMQMWMAILLLASMFVIIRGLLKKSHDRASAIDLDDLILEFSVDGKKHVSVLRVTYIGSFVFSIWLMVYLALTGKMTEGYMGIFNSAWALPLSAAIIWGKKPVLPKLYDTPSKEEQTS